LHDDCRLALLQPFTVDAIITDPPYEMGFMSKDWDKTGIAYDVAMWKLCLDRLKPGGHLLAFGGARTYHRMACAIEDAGFQIRDQIMWIYASGFPKHKSLLKPAHEPIVLAKKPGKSILNIDNCRIENRERTVYGLATAIRSRLNTYGKPTGSTDFDASKGRWPANVIHDGNNKLGENFRFFYCARASTDERNGSKHPTVKPLNLMRYLCRLITPPNGTILDPFAGSGTTGEAAQLEGFNAILIEQNEIYINDIYNRLNMESVKCQV